jgi:hypothetical protein
VTPLLAALAGPDRLSWRRPVFVLAILACSVGLALHGTLTGAQWVELAQVLVVAGIAGEAVPAAMKVQRSAPANSPQTPEAP